MSRDRILDKLTSIFDHPLIGKAGRTSRMAGMSRADQERHIWQAVNRTPEVMVKISGYGRGAQHALAHLNYVGDKKGREDVDMENERGDIFVGKEDIETLWKSWRLPDDPLVKAEDENEKKKPAARETMHIVLSMPPGTDTEKMRCAVRAFSQETFPNNQYVFGEHTDEEHPHFHLTVKMRGRNGKKINTRKGDTVKWRERFAETLREHGVHAVATPRAVRGVIRKSKNQSIWHIEDRANQGEKKKDGSPYKRSSVQTAKEDLAADEILGKLTPTSRPFEKEIEGFQTQLRGAMLEAANDYQARGGEGDLVKAELLRNFVGGMPLVETEHQALVRGGTAFADFVRTELANRGEVKDAQQVPNKGRGK